MTHGLEQGPGADLDEPTHASDELEANHDIDGLGRKRCLVRIFLILFKTIFKTNTEFFFKTNIFGRVN